MEIQAVTTTFPSTRSFARTFDTASTVKAYKSAYINPKVAGTILKFHVKEGDKVKKGQVLAQLDPSDYQIAVNASEAQMAAAQAGVMQAEAAFHKISQDYESLKPTELFQQAILNRLKADINRQRQVLPRRKLSFNWQRALMQET